MTKRTAAGEGPGPRSRAEEARSAADRALEALAEQLDAGNSQQLDAFLKALGRFHKYSFNNIMLILSQKPEATRVAGFHTWRSFGRTVKKGEKGILILAPMRIRVKDRAAEPTPGEDTPTVLRFRAAHVFDISQTEGEPLPEPARAGGDPGEYLGRLEALVSAKGIDLTTAAIEGGVHGVSKGGAIVLAEELSGPERFSVLVHELAHEMLHRVEARPSKTVRELEAEAVAHAVSDAIGLDSVRASADYIRLYSGDRKVLAASLDRIQRTACEIITGIVEDQNEDERSKVTVSTEIALTRSHRVR